MMEKVRVRFAPSPTGALHIGGIRTALYNYLIAKKTGGTFILRIEDTDQGRFVPGAEEYIIDALRWAGINPDEGPGIGGSYGPYRQSERKSIYLDYATQMVERGHAYYAFDTAEALEAARNEAKAQGNHSFKYDALIRDRMKTSLGLSPEEIQQKINSGEPYVIRLLVQPGQQIVIQDMVRGEVVFNSDELDDKILLKSDGMPTYHLANVIDDRLMKISHVIRGEEWLPSTAHHVLLYRAMGWEQDMPRFAHLPLILKPDGKGKLSKRDGLRLGIPVFPLGWDGDTEEDSFKGFRDFGFLPQAMVNFMAFMGWNPGTEQEIFNMEELIAAFSIDKIGKAGARFDFDKARWFNQQYIMACDNDTLAKLVRPIIEQHGHQPDDAFLTAFCGLMKERVVLLTDFWDKGSYFFTDVTSFDKDNVKKRWNQQKKEAFTELSNQFGALNHNAWQQPATLKATCDQFMLDNQLKPGDILPLLRIALAGTMQGPAVFEMMQILGSKETLRRLNHANVFFDTFV